MGGEIVKKGTHPHSHGLERPHAGWSSAPLGSVWACDCGERFYLVINENAGTKHRACYAWIPCKDAKGTLFRKDPIPTSEYIKWGIPGLMVWCQDHGYQNRSHQHYRFI